MRTVRSQGTEYLVKGLLEMMGIPTAHIGGSHRGYDLVASNPDAGRSCRIQVKGRDATEYGFHLKEPQRCDFVIFIPATYTDGRTPTTSCFVFPAGICALHRSYPKRPKLVLKNVPDVESYRDNWLPVLQMLGHKGGAT